MPYYCKDWDNSGDLDDSESLLTPFESQDGLSNPYIFAVDYSDVTTDDGVLNEMKPTGEISIG